MISKPATHHEEEGPVTFPPEEDAYLPSPQRIHRLCTLYQQGWTARERWKRNTVKIVRWTVPEVSFHSDSSSLPEE